MGGKAGKLRVECEFLGVVNGVPVTVIGKGHVGDGRLDIELHADVVPLHWDPALVVFGSLDVILAVASLDGGTDSDGRPDPIFAHTDFVLLDDGHRELGRIEMSLRAEIGLGCVRIRGQFLRARTNLEPTERVTTVERVCCGSFVPLGRDGVVQTSTAAFETSFGHEYLSVAVSRVMGVGERLESLRRSQAGAEIRDLTIGRAGGRERDHRVLVGAEYGTHRVGTDA